MPSEVPPCAPTHAAPSRDVSPGVQSSGGHSSAGLRGVASRRCRTCLGTGWASGGSCWDPDSGGNARGERSCCGASFDEDHQLGGCAECGEPCTACLEPECGVCGADDVGLVVQVDEYGTVLQALCGACADGLCDGRCEFRPWAGEVVR